MLSGLVSLILISLLGLGAAAWGLHILGSIERIDDVALDQVLEGEPVNYLIIGNDERGDGDDDHDGPALADSIAIFRIDPEERQAAVLTVPRDLLLPLVVNGEFDPNSTPEQINHAYASETGRDDVADTLRQNFGIEIHHYIELNFDGFRSLLDSVGGVEVWIDEAIHDPSTGLLIEELGCVTLDAETAMQFVRSRNLHTMGESGWVQRDVTADLGRNTRQREFIQQALGKALREAPTDPNQMRQTIESLADTVAISDSMSLTELPDLVEAFRGLDPADEESFRADPLPVLESESQAGRVVLDDLRAEPVLNVFRGLPEDEVSPRAIELTIRNGTGVEDQATNVAGAFQEIGFNIGEVGDTEEEPATTTVYHPPGEERLGSRVARHVTGSVWVLERDGLEEGTVEVVTGADFETIHETATDLEDMPDTVPPGFEELAGEAGEDSSGEEPSDSEEAENDEASSTTPSTTLPPAEDNTFEVGAGHSCA